MNLASFFFISVAIHSIILTLPLAHFEAKGERMIPVTLLLEKGKKAAPAPRADVAKPDAPVKPVRMGSPPRPAEPEIKETHNLSAVEQEKIGSIESGAQPPRRVQAADRAIEERQLTPRPAYNGANQTVAVLAEAHSAATDGLPHGVKEPRRDRDLTTSEGGDYSAATFSSARYAYTPKPEYPDQAKRRGWEGTVLLRVLVNPQGAPESIEINRSSGFDLLDQVARKTVTRWRFHPAHDGEREVPSWVKIPIIFRLADAKN